MTKPECCPACLCADIWHFTEGDKLIFKCNATYYHADNGEWYRETSNEHQCKRAHDAAVALRALLADAPPLPEAVTALIAAAERWVEFLHARPAVGDKMTLTWGEFDKALVDAVDALRRGAEGRAE